MNHERLLRMPPRTLRQQYGVRDTILYALGVGAGSEPDELRYVYEKDLATLPTMAVVLAWSGTWIREPEFGVDGLRLLHAEQTLALHRPLAPEGCVASELKVDGIYDKGRETGALLCLTRRLYDEASGDLLATMRQSLMLRGDGGFKAQKDATPSPAAMPTRPPDRTIDLPTRSEQALLYRLNGDYNPLHADPQIAAAAGFPQPILHGLCTYGIAGRALLRAGQSRGAGLTRLDARFRNPVFPGETIRTHIWREGPQIAFRCESAQRGVVVLDNGVAAFGD